MSSNHYQFLGVAQSANKTELQQAARQKIARIKLAYKQENFKFFGLDNPDPDVLKSRAESSIKRVKTVYEVLMNPEKRSQYDALIAKRSKPVQNPKVKPKPKSATNARPIIRRVNNSKSNWLRKNWKISVIMLIALWFLYGLIFLDSQTVVLPALLAFGIITYFLMTVLITPLRPSFGVKAVAYLIAFFLTLSFTSGVIQTKKTNEAEAEAIAQAKIRQADLLKRQTILRAEFDKNRGKILRAARDFNARQEYERTVRQTHKYSFIQDDELINLYKEADDFIRAKRAAEIKERLEIEAKTAMRKQQRAEAKQDIIRAYDLCRASTRSRMTFPSSASFHIFGAQDFLLDDGQIIINMNFDAKNTLGNELPLETRCIIRDGKVTSVKILRR